MQNLVTLDHDTTLLYNLPYLRVTALQTFEKCPYTWAMQYLIAGPEQIQSKYAKIGTAVHTICEQEIDYIHKNKPRDAKEVAEAWAIVTDINEKVNLKEYLTKFAEDLTAKHIATEIRLHQKFHPDAPNISGQLDFVFEDAEGCLVIMDHKTHRQFHPVSYWEGRLQQLCYAWMARKQWPEYKRVKFRIGYPNQGMFIEWETFAEDDAATVARLNKAWASMVEYNRANKWPQTINDECTYCACRTTCAASIQSIQNFKDSFIRTVGAQSTAEKLTYVKNVIKSAEALEADLTAKLAEEIKEAGGELKVSDGYWCMASSTRRSATFIQTWDTLFRFASATPGAGEIMREMAEEIFSVKVGGLEKFGKRLGADFSALMTENASAPSPTFKSEKTLTRSLRISAKKAISE